MAKAKTFTDGLVKTATNRCLDGTDMGIKGAENSDKFSVNGFLP